ncbi:MAG: hypothetical protein II652_00670, partial [Bacteroidales bacterium]|nr:hypothetical protein [Bacteroidales bacterium]
MKIKHILLTSAAVLLSLAAKAQEVAPKTGWSFTPMPDVSYNSDIGLNLGAFCDFFYYGDGSDYPNFQHHIATCAAWSTKGAWYAHLMGESKTLIPGTRVNGSLTFREATMNPFYGFNGPWSPFDNALHMNTETRTAWYNNDRLGLRAVFGIRGPLVGNLEWTAGAIY